MTSVDSELYGAKIAGSTDRIPIAVSEYNSSTDQYWFAYTRHDSNNTPEYFVYDVEFQVRGKTLAEVLNSVFGTDLYSKLDIVLEGYDDSTNDGLKAVSQNWSPNLPKRNGELP